MSKSYKTLREVRGEQGWGDVAVGDYVTSRGRHGVGQPAVTGLLTEVERGMGRVTPIVGQAVPMRRSLSNLRRITEEEARR